MKNLLKFTILLVTIFASLFFFNCNKDDFANKNDENLINQNSLKATYKRGADVSQNVINYLKGKTNNSLRVSFSNKRISLSSGNVNSRETIMGTINTEEEIIVNNETNIKHTLLVENPDLGDTSITNVIITENEFGLSEYFIKYIFDESIPYRLDGSIDFSKFSGTIETYDINGNLTGSLTIQDGTATEQTGEVTSVDCPDEDDNTTNPDDNPDDDSNTGGGGSNVGDGTDGSTGDTSTGDSTGGGWFADETGGCGGLSWEYGECGCPTAPYPPDGHSITGNPCCNGSPLIVKDCSGNVVAQSRTTEGGGTKSFYDPCAGAVGVILDLDQITYDNSWDPYPCQKAIVNEAITTCSTLTNEILSIFESNDYSNLNFTVSNTIPGNGQTSPQSSYNSTTGVCTTTIKIKQTYVASTTDISLARTAIHESVHAILVYLFESGKLLSETGEPIEGYENLVKAHVNYSLGLPANLGKSHHEVMVEYVDKIATALENYSNGVGHTNSSDYYKKLAWNGLMGTSSFNTLYPKYLNPADATSNPTNINPAWLDVVNTNAAEQDNTTYTFNHPNGTTYTHAKKGNTPNTTEPCY